MAEIDASHGLLDLNLVAPFIRRPGIWWWFQIQKSFGSQKRFRTGTKTFRLTSNDIKVLTGDVFTSAEADYTAKGLQQTVQGHNCFN